ncbi:fumarylacetoacetate hydrolase [Agrobacterium vitis]|uniref:fumarylacetoacetate hydrolase family protein n=1 Tax=Rhizobium/Agrobacterium group TaxID=227290 RepID=UPI0012E83004|nr:MULTISPECIES: fumarylacetoacetate hydrolase family protein [Rhizobium/Agrobacterium group]MCF1493740.1 fumarylacetoacetate hydrolase family protein [Allorhizobium ampelinum]MVA47125.1 fumarylacetoacetate hydrolase [Agrobacterium vitis]
MKLAFFDSYKLGVVRGDVIIDVSSAVETIAHVGPHDLMQGLIERFDEFRSALEAAADAGEPISLASVALRAPLPKPSNIVCMAVNYMEDGTLAEPPAINAFHKAPTAVIGPGGTMVLPDIPARTFEGEAEMALVIGKRAHQVSAENWRDYVFGYVNFIDGSARGTLPEKNNYFQMKSRDTFAPIGPWIVTADEIPDPQSLQVRLWVNGTIKQDFNTDDMAHKIPRCIEWLSHIQVLEPGDVVATGTNHRGLNALQDGDSVELEIEGLGRLAINVRDDLKRTWPRDTRVELMAKGVKGPAVQLTGKHAPVSP